MEDRLERVYRYIKKYDMIRQRDSVLLGVSGGADSVCLFLMLKHLSDVIGFSLRVVTVEHGIRGADSKEDARFVEKLCITNDIPCKVIYVDAQEKARTSGMSLEEAARHLRYDAFFSMTKSGDVIATAHNAGDNAETLLFNLIRGTGVRGLAGIAPVSVQRERRIVRPLLCLERKDIEGYLAECQQTYRTDSTNFELDADRNKLRNVVIPQLVSINPKAVRHMSNAAEDLVALTRDKEKKEEVILTKAKTYRGLDFRKLLFMQWADRNHMILNWLRDELEGAKDIGRVHVDAVCELIDGKVGRGVDIPGGLRVEKTYRELIIKPQGEVIDSGTDVATPIPLLSVGDRYQISYEGMYIKLSLVGRSDAAGKEIPQKTYEKWFDYDKIKDNIVLRHRRSGDMISTVRGGHKRFKDYCIDEKIDREIRDRIMLLADGDNIVWAIGYRSSEEYKVSASTQRVLVAEVTME